MAGETSEEQARPLLEMRRISKSFGGHLVLRGVSLRVFPGEVLAFLGENGAGKSTLIKILAGVYQKDAGEIVFEDYGEIKSAAAVSRSGRRPIAFIHQDLGLIDWMTIAENMAFSLGFPRGRGSLIAWKRTEEQAGEALKRVGVDLSPRTRVFRLSQAEKAGVAIARAVAGEARLLVLDEPTAGLPAEDVHKLFEIIAVLKSRGVGMIYVTHRMDEVKRISDRVLIIRDGVVAADQSTRTMDSGEMIAHIVGKRQVNRSYKAPSPAPEESEWALELQGLRIGEVGPVSFRLAPGELLGLAGLRGAGHEKVGRGIFGAETVSEGRILIHNRPWELGPMKTPSSRSFKTHGSREARGWRASRPGISPKKAIRRGVSLLAANRMRESLVPGLSLEENLFLNLENHGYRPRQYYTQREIHDKSNHYIRRLAVHPDNPRADISALSGGNQQKVVLSRWLDIGNDILILEDPTAGVDVGARSEIYRIFLKLLASGKSLLLISADFEEAAKICSRVLVFNKNRISRELTGEEVTHESIFHYASR